MCRRVIEAPARKLAYFTVEIDGPSNTMLGFWDPEATVSTENEPVTTYDRVRFLDNTTGVVMATFYVGALDPYSRQLPLYGLWAEVKRGGWLATRFPWAFRSYLTPVNQLRKLS